MANSTRRSGLTIRKRVADSRFLIVITFDEEVMLVWGSAMSAGKALFFLNRYFTLATLICTAWTRTNWIAGTIVAAFSERKSNSYDEYFTRDDFPAVFLNYGDLSRTSCNRTTLPDTYKTFWSPLLVNEALLFSLAVYKGFQSLRKGTRTGNRLILFLVRDSVLFFFMVFTTFLASEIVWLIGGVNYIEILVSLALANASIWSQRLLLNIRKQCMGHQVIEGDLLAGEYSHWSVETSQGSGQDIVLATFRTLDTCKCVYINLDDVIEH
ncbi:hypothetical protein DFH11DRAFT_1546868 [Phellopilus nigrolimitatus]|nr:hypothetical protein DFH11DRAFT_1546868 [Phellopilus nigrolimitatus]